jgi:hypothetical protein
MQENTYSLSMRRSGKDNLRHGVRGFQVGRVISGHVFETAYLIDRRSVPLLCVNYSDKSNLKRLLHHPIWHLCMLCVFAYFLPFCLHVEFLFYIHEHVQSL